MRGAGPAVRGASRCPSCRSALEPEPEPEPESWWPSCEERAKLAARIDALRADEALRRRIEELPEAWVLVFHAGSEREAVYSLEQEGAHVVLAFEDRADADRYARSLEGQPPYHAYASVQALDVEALVVTSRDAHFRVGLVMKGEVREADAGALITSAASKCEVGITMVPEALYAGRAASDFLDPAEDPVWVLLHDAGTADAQYFQMSLNGTSSVLCFRDEAAAVRCGRALSDQGAHQPSACELTLEDLFERMDSHMDPEMEVCLVDEVVETIIDSEACDHTGTPGITVAGATDDLSVDIRSGPGSDAAPWVLPPGAGAGIASAEVRAMLTRLLGGEDGA